MIAQTLSTEVSDGFTVAFEAAVGAFIGSLGWLLILAVFLTVARFVVTLVRR